jgi:hypothetical protein
MIKRILLGAAPVAVLALLTACGGDDNAATTTATKVTATSSLAPTATVAAKTPAPSASTVELTSAKFEVPTTISASGFFVHGEAAKAFFLERQGNASAPGAYLALAIPTEVYDPDTGAQQPVPADFLAWLQGNTAVGVGGIERGVIVGGSTGDQTTVIGKGTAETKLFTATSSNGPQFTFTLAPAEPAILYVLNVSGKTVVITAGPSNAADFEMLAPELGRMIKSIKFQP